MDAQQRVTQSFTVDEWGDETFLTVFTGQAIVSWGALALIWFNTLSSVFAVRSTGCLKKRDSQQKQH